MLQSRDNKGGEVSQLVPFLKRASFLVLLAQILCLPRPVLAEDTQPAEPSVEQTFLSVSIIMI
jgi:hypothetical protein